MNNYYLFFLFISKNNYYVVDLLDNFILFLDSVMLFNVFLIIYFLYEIKGRIEIIVFSIIDKLYI